MAACFIPLPALMLVPINESLQIKNLNLRMGNDQEQLTAQFSY